MTDNVTVVQVHIRTKPCYNRRDGVTCNCAVAMREGNNILGLYACDSGIPPLAIRYLVDDGVPGAEMTVSRNGKKYQVCWACLIRVIDVISLNCHPVLTIHKFCSLLSD